MGKIDFEKILDEIKTEKLVRDYTEVPIKFEDIICEDEDRFVSDFDIDEFVSCLDHVNLNYEIQYYSPLPGTGIKIIIKRIIRKFMKFLILPMNQRQNTFNFYVTRCLNCLSNYVKSDNSYVNEKMCASYMSKKEVEEYFDFHEKNAERLETKIFLLEQKIADLEEQILNLK